jgi:hypothetical protein
MKHHIRKLACGLALLAAAGAFACGGKETMASKSAAAFDEAKKKGVPIAAGEHGGHSAEAGAETTGTDHAVMAGMDHRAMPGMQHGTPDSGANDMTGMDQSSMAGMDHAKMPGTQHRASDSGAHDMKGMDHSSMPGMIHGSMAGMQHGGSMMGMSGMQHGSATAAPIAIEPPTSNAAIAQTQPSATLHADKFDAPDRSAIEEAAKAATGMGHLMENISPKPPAPPQPDHKPQPQPPIEQHYHGGGEAS